MTPPANGKTTGNPYLFLFVTGLLYPGALGATLVWFVRAVTAFLLKIPNQPLPTCWMTFFVGWFALYHCVFFLRLRAKYTVTAGTPATDQIKATSATVEPPYKIPHLVSDLLDSIALFGALGALDFQLGSPSPNRAVLAFVAAALVAISALVSRFAAWSRIDVLTILALLIALAGAWINFCHVPSAPTFWNPVLLVALWVLLLLYFLCRAVAKEKEGQASKSPD